MSKICQKCGFSNNEIAEFCSKCGNELESTEEKEIFCPSCSSTIPQSSKFCKNCGSSLDNEPDSENNTSNQENTSVNTQSNLSNDINCPYCGGSINVAAEKCRHCGEWVKKTQSQVYNQKGDGETHTLAIVLGYIFTFLGGWIGLIIAIYLLTRENENAKKHGKIQIILFVVALFIWILIIAAAA